MSLWDKVKAKAIQAGDATKLAAHKTKLRTDMMMIDREISNRKKLFGVQMYDHVSPLSQSADFYAASDDLTNIVRPPLITAQKEIQALAAKRVQLKESLAAAEAKRAGAFPTKAETYGGKLKNFGKAGVMHSGETKIKAELAVVDRKIKGHKQTFGLTLFETLSEAEDTRGYLPSDRQVRSIYDQTRQDIQSMQARKKLKEEELISIGGTPPAAAAADEQEAEAIENQQQPFTGGFSDNPPKSDSRSTGIPSATTVPINPASNNRYTDTPATTDSADGQMEDLLL